MNTFDPVTFLLAFLLIGVLIAVPCSIAALVMIIGLKNSTHRIQWVDASQSKTDEELEEEMLRPVAKSPEPEDFSEDSKRPRPLPSLFE